MTSAYRRSSAVVTRRAAVVERLRRVLFSPPKLIAVGALALALAAGNAFGEIFKMPNDDISVNEYEGGLNLEDCGYTDSTISYDANLSLDGGKVWLRTDMTAPVYNAANKTLYLWEFGPETNVKYTNDEKEQFLSRFKEVGLDLQAIYGNIDHIVTKNGHYFDLSKGGWLSIEQSVQTDSGKKLFEDLMGITVSAQTIENGFQKSGPGNLNFTSGTSNAKTSFNGGLEINGGTVNVASDALFQGLVHINGYNDKATLQSLNGNHIFDCKVLCTYGGSLDVTSMPEAQKTFKSTVEILAGGGLYSWGNVEYQDNVSVIGDNALAVFSENSGGGLSLGRPVWGKQTIEKNADGTEISKFVPSELYIADNANVYANANSLDVDVKLANGGVLNYTNVDRQIKDSPYFNKFYITLDENQTPTVLEWTAGSANIQKAMENDNVITQNLTSADANTQLYLTAMGMQTANQVGEANGYTVVFNNADGKKFDYAGRTMVDNGFMVVQDDTNFGSFNAAYNKETGANRSHFRVFGEAYSKVNDNTWQVHGSGMLGFDRDDAGLASSAPSITADWVEFTSGVITVSVDEFTAVCTRHMEEILMNSDLANLDIMAVIDESQKRAYKEYKSNSYVDGARIWIDAGFNGKFESQDNKTFKLGAINANAIAFEDNTQIWYDGISAQPSDVKMTFDLNAPTIKYQTTSDVTMGPGEKSYVIGREVVENRTATVGDIEDLFGAAVLVDATYAPAAAPVDATDLTEAQRRAQLATAGTVTISAKNVGDYAAEQGMSGKEQELAQKLDGARVDGGQSSARFYDALYNETDGGKVRQTIHNLSLLGYTMLNSQGHFGNPTSSFFGGASLSGEAKRGQEFDPNVIDPEPEPSAIAKQVYNPKQSVWAAYTHTSVDGDDYDFGGVTMHGYKLRRDGIIGGIRRQADATTSAGLFFGLSMPEVESRNALNAYGQIAGNGYGTVGSKMEMTDFQFAGHVDKVLADVWELSLYAGGGTQAMEWERDANLTNGGYYKYEADGSGNTLTGTIYLAYRANVNDSLVLRPTIGVDSEHSWLYGFAETATVEGQGGADNVLLDPYTDMFAQAYTYKKTYYNRNTARAGLSFAYSNPRNDLMGLNGRVFYGVKLGGDDAPELSYYSANYKWDNMESHEMGDSSLNVGGGGFMHLNALKTLTATGDVNAIWYKNAQTFNVTGGVNYRF